MTAGPTCTDDGPVSDRRMVRALWLVLLAAIISLFPFTIYSTFLVPIAATVRASEAEVGFLRGLGGLAALVAGIALAPLLTRWPRQHVAAAALGLLAGTSLLATSGRFAALIAFCVGIGLATAVLTPTLLTLATSRFSDPGNMGRAATTVTATQSLAAVLAGPVIGGLGVWRGWQGALWITAAVSALIAAGFLRAGAGGSPASPSMPTGYADSWRRLRSRPDLLVLIAIAALRTTSFMGYLAFLAVFYHDRLAYSATTFALVWTLSGSAFFLGNYATGRWVRDPGSAMGRRPRTTLAVGLLGALVAVLGVFHAPALPAALLGTALMGFSHAVVAAQLTTLLARLGGELSTIAFSVNAAGMSLGVFAGALLGGLGLDLAGHTGLAIALGLPTALALALLRVLRGTDDARDTA
ncbi:hypothetical protein GCM10027088_01010 [Nocardia goodfellowii]